MTDTTDSQLRSFIEVSPESHFPIQNLPLGVFLTAEDPRPRVGTALGETIIDLAVLERRGLLDVPALANRPAVFDRSSLNTFLALGRSAWSEVRERLSRLLRREEPRLRDDALLRSEAIVPADRAELLLPVEIGDYTDFYSSREHATNVGAMLRGPAHALMPNWLHLPVAYHGRASSVVVSGTDVIRPCGQTKADDAPSPMFGPSRAVDFELELGAIIGPGNPLGEPVPIDRADEQIFGCVLVNDWSARDIQKWEYVPLGPFLAKNFATSISPWVVPLAALEPFRVPGPPQDPEPLPYLRSADRSALDIHLEVWLQPSGSNRASRIVASNARHLYWSFRQQVAHHTSNGCNLRTGDLLATGTISGSAADSRGCLLELTSGGWTPLTLPNGAVRTYLADGDRVTLTGWCQGPGYRVGFGETTGRLLPARRPDADRDRRELQPILD